MFRDKRRLKSWIAIAGIVLLAMLGGYYLGGGLSSSGDAGRPAMGQPE